MKKISRCIFSVILICLLISCTFFEVSEPKEEHPIQEETEKEDKPETINEAQYKVELSTSDNLKGDNPSISIDESASLTAKILVDKNGSGIFTDATEDSWSYYWYVDNVLISSMNSKSFTIGSETGNYLFSSAGIHKITCLATYEEYSLKKSFTLTVTEQTDTGCQHTENTFGVCSKCGAKITYQEKENTLTFFIVNPPTGVQSYHVECQENNSLYKVDFTPEPSMKDGRFDFTSQFSEISNTVGGSACIDGNFNINIKALGTNQIVLAEKEYCSVLIDNFSLYLPVIFD